MDKINKIDAITGLLKFITDEQVEGRFYTFTMLQQALIKLNGIEPSSQWLATVLQQMIDEDRIVLFKDGGDQIILAYTNE